MSVESKRKAEHLCVKEVRLYKVLWDNRYGRTAHSFTFSSGVTFGMLRKFWKLQDLSTVPGTTVDSFKSHCIKKKAVLFHNIKLPAFCMKISLWLILYFWKNCRGACFQL